LITPLICCSCLSKADEETMNFIIRALVGKYKINRLKCTGKF
jgi:hypothetical protein